MKSNLKVYYHSAHYFPAYPNEADTNYYMKKLLDIVTGLASGIGLTASIIFLMMIM